MGGMLAASRRLSQSAAAIETCERFPLRNERPRSTAVEGDWTARPASAASNAAARVALAASLLSLSPTVPRDVTQGFQCSAHAEVEYGREQGPDRVYADAD